MEIFIIVLHCFKYENMIFKEATPIPLLCDYVYSNDKMRFNRDATAKLTKERY